MAPRPRLSTLAACFRAATANAPTALRPLRCFSTSSQIAIPPPPPPRWVSDLKDRLGKCIIFGCSPAQVQRASKVLRALATEWRELVAGNEGFLTGGKRGMEDQQILWGEMDSFQHVNNVNYARWAETSRVNWITHFATLYPAERAAWLSLMTPETVGLIMKTITVSYKMPLTYPDNISVYHKLRQLPKPTDTELILDCIVVSHRHRRIAATTAEDVALYDYQATRKTKIPGWALEGFARTWQQQEEARQSARTRIWELLDEVNALEKETWNREDAVEDLGAAAKP